MENEERKEIPLEGFGDTKPAGEGAETPKEEPKEVPAEEPKEAPAEESKEAPAEEPPKEISEEVLEAKKKIPLDISGAGRPPQKKRIPDLRSLPRPLLAIYALAAALVISLVLNISLSCRTSALKQKMKDNTQVVKEIITGKKKTLDEKTSLKEEVERLKIELLSTSKIHDALDRQIKGLENELEKSKEKRSELDEKMKGYAEEVKELASARIGYYDDYESEKENAERLTIAIEELKKQSEALEVEVDSADEKFREKEADYIYEIAFAYVEAEMFDKALENFARFLDLRSGDAETHYNIAYIQEQIKKDNHKAISHYKEYLALKPDAEDLREVKARIASLKREERKKHGFFENLKFNLNEMKL